MQTPRPPDSDPSIAANSLPVSPREAAMRALVYRRLLREKPRASGRRIAGWVGTLLIHLVFLFGMILGPAYNVLPPPPGPDTPDALQVRLLDKPPPPVPPVRGTPSTAPVAKVKHTTTWDTKASRAARGSHAAAVAATKTPSRPAVAAPAVPAPKVKPAPKPVAPPPSVAAVAERPMVQPKAPPPQRDLEKVPLPTPAPPDLAVDTPKPQVVPPTFQPEPVRRPQEEGSETMPPPASLDIPPTPASQMTVTPTPPTITAERTTPVPTQAMTLATVPRPEVEESSAPPTPQDVPLPQVAPEPAAPTPDLTVDTRPVPPKVSAQTVQAVQAPAVEAEAELEAVPLPDAVAKPSVSAPVATVDRPSVQAPAVSPGEMQRPVAGADTAPSAPGQAPGDTATGEAAAAQAAATEGKQGQNQAADAVQGQPAGKASPGDANVAGSNTPGAAQESGKPGAAKGVDEGDRLTGANGTSNRSDGVAGGQGDKTGQVGAYTELKPRGNVTVQNGPHFHVDYKPTRFDGAWTPKGESSVDTALRHGVEASTAHFAVPLPRGIRLNCTAGPGTAGAKNASAAMNAISIFSLGCSGGDGPPAPANTDATVKNQTMAPAKPLAENLPPANAATVAAAPVALDNTAYCTAARIAGGPLPPGCEASIKINVPAPKAASGSWVPASDQFK
ncbi:hypothetical protein BJI69_03075 [Luteibacter rhizovicinus DSM 16549]|uniref:Uncharacterized protein n=1 Tax=Luteibacter rhizovicinus DSM 16549 TaxID=1440763 RepID=A0A0G9H6Q6_9GAMM|nr:hypothetical protein [Luteibacter rhizovicinus]APG02988.1 hypothetical protein BJI69_03075 [Luteibacter rhizovicinus DSM 16549]KLD63382.1 hypothetical protein Y883_19770 [Luteibacter rhizovicinus DSM 16549]